MNKILFISDIHLGITTDNVDRTKEIIRVIKNSIILRAEKLISEGHKVDIIFGGDIFNKNTPSEYLVSVFIKILNMFSNIKCHVYVMSGNHDSVSDPARLSCLSFIRNLSEVYSFVTLVDDIKAIRYHTEDGGKHYLLFLPHINNAHLENKKIKYKNVQDYIDKKTTRILDKLGNGINIIAFSHLNIIGAVAGDEANLLNKSTCFIPKKLVEKRLDGLKNTVISGHYHKSSYHNGIDIIGAPIYTDFSDCDIVDKFIGEITLPKSITDKVKVELHKTSCTNFVSIVVEAHTFMKDVNITNRIIKLAIKQLKKVKRGFLKLDISINTTSLNYLDTKKIENFIYAKYGYTVKKIVPKIIKSTRKLRNKNLVIGLKPIDSLKEYMVNDKVKKEDQKEIIELAESYFGKNL